jgi:cytochrome c
MCKCISVILLCGFVLFGATAFAGDTDATKATPEDVYRLVVNAHGVLSVLGEKGLEAFNNPKGEFVFKDTYVYVLQCPEYIVAHPFALDKLKGKDLRPAYPFQNTLCQGAANRYGTWVEYRWPKPGQTEPSRKVAFVISVEGTPYQVAAGIYNDELSVDQLNSLTRK